MQRKRLPWGAEYRTVCAMMRKPMILLAACLGLVACGEEEPKGPPMSKIFVRNDSSTEANLRIKFWSKDYMKVSAGDSAEIAFVNQDGINAVQVEAKTRKQWDDCWVTMNVGETIVVFDAVERIGCRVE
ncbi:hypothetical protein T8K17_15255 [Thalassobaculum sp. OXR-137]|uniref:hypothetical protein n=1 Tax=Thalassobaculum sp. OXR-137 TaxID=3100173 RepID=UPI002AC90EF3|nr:hypothetical protein [Thalassobaculum sp. OXR-137]WPZ32600.1 hypothetical protein T8K17_15255 [Thalassobaculum sp. OXR-137]